MGKKDRETNAAEIRGLFPDSDNYSAENEKLQLSLPLSLQVSPGNPYFGRCRKATRFPLTTGRPYASDTWRATTSHFIIMR